MSGAGPSGNLTSNMHPPTTFEKQIVVMINIIYMNVVELNLNLLVSFDALIAEQNVTRAARRVGLTQSAMSNALAQLRRIFDDPLFTRSPGGVTATERAVALSGPVRQALLRSMPFCEFWPFRIFRRPPAASDYVEYVVLAPLLRALQREAPHVRVAVHPWGRHDGNRPAQARNRGLMLGFYGAVPAGHHDELLFDEEYVCLVRKGHPLVDLASLSSSMRRFRTCWSPRARRAPDRSTALSVRWGSAARLACVSRISRWFPRWSRKPIWWPPSAVGRRAFAKILPLRFLPPPLALPTSRVGQVWHSRTNADPAHVWFRDVVRRVSALCDAPRWALARPRPSPSPSQPPRVAAPQA